MTFPSAREFNILTGESMELESASCISSIDWQSSRLFIARVVLFTTFITLTVICLHCARNLLHFGRCPLDPLQSAPQLVFPILFNPELPNPSPVEDEARMIKE